MKERIQKKINRLKRQIKAHSADILSIERTIVEKETEVKRLQPE